MSREAVEYVAFVLTGLLSAGVALGLAFAVEAVLGVDFDAGERWILPTLLAFFLWIMLFGSWLMRREPK